MPTERNAGAAEALALSQSCGALAVLDAARREVAEQIERTGLVWLGDWYGDAHVTVLVLCHERDDAEPGRKLDDRPERLVAARALLEREQAARAAQLDELHRPTWMRRAVNATALTDVAPNKERGAR